LGSGKGLLRIPCGFPAPVSASEDGVQPAEGVPVESERRTLRVGQENTPALAGHRTRDAGRLAPVDGVVLVLDGASHVTVDSVTVHDIGYEGVHFRKSSAYGVIKNSNVYNTGLEQPGYGEGSYLGSSNSNWDCYGTNKGKSPDAGNYIQVLNNKIGPNVAAEGIDIKEGTHDGLISGNTLDGTGEKNQNSADSVIDVKGDKYTITGNTAKNAYLDTFQVHNVYQKTGCGNTFSKNTLTVTDKNGYGINVTDQSECVSAKTPNVVGASNTSTGGKGLSKVVPTPGI
jgi:hypothetical protein